LKAKEPWKARMGKGIKAVGRIIKSTEMESIFGPTVMPTEENIDMASEMVLEL
jgi:hypothetical protein